MTTRDWFTYVNASVASSREPNSAYQIGGLPRGVFSCSSRIGTTGLKNYKNRYEMTCFDHAHSITSKTSFSPASNGTPRIFMVNETDIGPRRNYSMRNQ